MTKINDGISKEDSKIRSFLMIGQSNMAGRGEFADVPQIKNDRCFMLRMGRWQPMSEPINVDRDILNIKFHSGVCLATSFADEVAKLTGWEVGLIPCADGGTTISQWQPGGLLFDHAVMTTGLATRTSELAGIIWHQGESDCLDFDPERYARDFLNTMTTLRRQLNAEHLPLIIGELSEKCTVRPLDVLRSFNRLLPQLADQLPCCGVVNTQGLEMKPDNLHFNSASLRKLGVRYFEKYKELTAANDL
ncbi:MAG: sialate O-acetylesterase [Oscillospiraceae bacterium]|nr:sialate O-acetylesterase [Oscillospiraceae bacterium]